MRYRFHRGNPFPLLTRLELVLFVTLAAIFQGMAAAPEIQPIGNTTIDEQTLLAFTVAATDPDVPAQQLTFSLGSGSQLGATLNGTTGEFKWTPTEAQGPSTNLFSVIVTDNGIPSMSATQRFTVVVLDINQPPVISPIANQTLNEGALLVASALVTDPDLPQQSISFALGPNTPTGANISTGGLITWLTDELHGPSTNLFEAIATDNGSPSLSTTQTFFVVVNEVNRGPTMSDIPAKSVNEGELLTFTITATDSDLPVQLLTFSLGADSPNGASINPTTGVFAWTPGENIGPGIYYFSAYATDNGSPPQLDARGFLVTVAEINRPPELASIEDKTVNEGQFLGFSVIATDPDVPAQTLTLSLNADAPVGATLSPGGFFSWSPTDAQGPATYTFAVSATDNGTPSLSATQRFTVIVVEANLAPTLAAIEDQTLDEGELLSFAASASDPNGPSQTLTFRLGDGAPEGATIDPLSGVFAWTPTEAQGPGSFQFGIIVTDSGTPTLSAARSFLVSVAEVNRPPVLSPVADQTINVGGLLVFTLPVEDPDIPHQTLSYALGANTPAGAAISEGGLFTWTPTAAQLLTTNRLAVTVTDGSLSATQRFTVIVVEANLAPTLAAIEDQTLDEGELLSFAASASDPNGPSQTLTFRLGDGAPEGATIDPLSGVFAWTPTEAQGPGSFQFGIIVTDSGTPTLSAARSFLVSVAEVNRPPVLSPVADQTINVGGLLVFTLPVEDPDIPHQTLSYALGANTPAGAAISEGGLFTWTPTAAQANSTNVFDVVVTDDGFPSRSGTNQVRIIVTIGTLTRPTLRSPTLADGTFTVTLEGVSGRTYFLERTLTLEQPDWVVVDEVVSSGGPMLLTDLNPTGMQSFYRVRTQ